MRHARRIAAAAIALTLAGAGPTLMLAGAGPTLAQDAAATPPSTAETPARDDVAVLVTPLGSHTFSVEIADDPIERARGLMFREEMARDHGMLFDFGREGHRDFWMMNTPLSLDIIYIRGDGTVDSIAAGTTPFSTDSIPSDGPAQFVLEVNAGVAAEIGLKPGDRLLHRRVVGR